MRVRRAGIAFAFAAAVIEVGCGREAEGPGTSVGLADRSAPQEPDSSTHAADFSLLARTLADPILSGAYEPSPSTFSEEAELYAEANRRLLTYERLRDSHPAIASLAQTAAASHQALLEAQMNLAGGGDAGAGILLLSLGALAGSPEILFAGLQGTVEDTSRQSSLVSSLATAFQRHKGSQLTLPTLAPEFSGPEVPDCVRVEFDESWRGQVLPFDTVYLQYLGSTDLSDCLIEITLTGRAGDSRRNVHYASAWKSGEWLVAQYGMGADLGGGVRVGAQTVYSVQSVRVSLWSPTLTCHPSLYRYDASELDKDVRRFLEKSLHIEGEPRTGLLDAPSTLSLTMSGVAELPISSMRVRYFKGEDVVSNDWSQVSMWRQGESKRFAPRTTLPWPPERAEITIAFPDTSFEYALTVDF